MAVTFLDKAARRSPRASASLSCGLFRAASTSPKGATGSYLRYVEIGGPYDATGPGQTASRERIFVCRPAIGAATPTAEAESCAKTILASLVRRAYRRPVADADVAPLLDFYRAGHGEEGSFDGGIQVALKALLVSPEFLFRVDARSGRRGAGIRCTASATSSSRRGCRSSYGAASPTTSCCAQPSAARSRKPAELERQVRRMIADPRADAFVSNFAGQWLYLRNLDAVIPVQSIFPNFDDTLREGLRRETELFFASVLREDRSVLDLLERRLHVRQRARRAALRHCRTSKAVTSGACSCRPTARAADCSATAACSP